MADESVGTPQSAFELARAGGGWEVVDLQSPEPAAIQPMSAAEVRMLSPL